MAEKKAKTAEKGGDAARKLLCPSCGAETRVVQYAGAGPRGFFWVCEKNCGYTRRTRLGGFRLAWHARARATRAVGRRLNHTAHSMMKSMRSTKPRKSFPRTKPAVARSSGSTRSF